MAKILPFKVQRSKVDANVCQSHSCTYFFSLILYSDEIDVLYRLTETWLPDITSPLDETVLEILKNRFEDILKQFDYEADYFIEIHIYGIDPMIKYIKKEIDSARTNKKEKIILNRVFSRLKEIRKYYEYELQKACFLTERQRYLIMLDDWNQKIKKEANI